MRAEELPAAWEWIVQDVTHEELQGVRQAHEYCARQLREVLRWIPCSERLPTEDGRYEVFIHGEVDFAKKLGADWWHRGVRCTGDVTHWRQLPKGPDQ